MTTKKRSRPAPKERVTPTQKLQAELSRAEARLVNLTAERNEAQGQAVRVALVVVSLRGENARLRTQAEAQANRITELDAKLCERDLIANRKIDDLNSKLVAKNLEVERMGRQQPSQLQATTMVLELDGRPVMHTGPILVPSLNRLDTRLSGAEASPQYARRVVLKVDGKVMLTVASTDPNVGAPLRVGERQELERLKQVLEQVRTAHRNAVSERAHLKAALKQVDDLLASKNLLVAGSRMRAIEALISRCAMAVAGSPDASKLIQAGRKIEQSLKELTTYAKGDHRLTQRLHMLELYRADGWPVWGQS